MPPVNMPQTHADAATKKLTCGSCQWFNSGLQGNNCRKLREVEVDTPACIEFTVILKDQFHEISKDKTILQLREELRHNRFKVDDKILEELRGYVIQEDFTKFRFGTQQDVGTMQQALMQIVTYRSRVSFIYTSMIDIQVELESKVKTAKMWLVSKYKTYQDLKNEEMREAALNRLLPELIPITTSLNKVVLTAKHLDEKLDKNDWTLRTILESVQKSHFKERIV
jgi:hypothetical protein